MKPDDNDNTPFLVLAAVVLIISALVLAWVLA